MNSVGTTYTNPDFLVGFSFLEHEKTILLSAYVRALPLQDSRIVDRTYVVQWSVSNTIQDKGGTALMQEFIIMPIPYILVTCVGTPAAILVIEFHWCLGRYVHWLFLCCSVSKAGILLLYALTVSPLVPDKALLSYLSRLCNNVVLNPPLFITAISILHPITSVFNVDILFIKSLLLLVPLRDILTTSSLVATEVSHSVGKSLFAKQDIVVAAQCGAPGSIVDKEGTITPMLKQMVGGVLDSTTHASRNIASPNYTVIYVCLLNSAAICQVILFGSTQATYIVMFRNTFAYLLLQGSFTVYQGSSMRHGVHTYCPPSLSQLLLYGRLFGELYLTVAGFPVFYVQILSPSFQWTFYCWGCFKCTSYIEALLLYSLPGSRDIYHDFVVISTLACFSVIRECSHMPSLICYKGCVWGFCSGQLQHFISTQVAPILLDKLTYRVLAIFPLTQVVATLGPIQNAGFHSGCCCVLIWHRVAVSFPFFSIFLPVSICLCLSGKTTTVGTSNLEHPSNNTARSSFKYLHCLFVTSWKIVQLVQRIACFIRTGAIDVVGAGHLLIVAVPKGRLAVMSSAILRFCLRVVVQGILCCTVAVMREFLLQVHDFITSILPDFLLHILLQISRSWPQGFHCVTSSIACLNYDLVRLSIVLLPCLVSLLKFWGVGLTRVSTELARAILLHGLVSPGNNLDAFYPGIQISCNAWHQFLKFQCSQLLLEALQDYVNVGVYIELLVSDHVPSKEDDKEGIARLATPLLSDLAGLLCYVPSLLCCWVAVLYLGCNFLPAMVQSILCFDPGILPSFASMLGYTSWGVTCSTPDVLYEFFVAWKYTLTAVMCSFYSDISFRYRRALYKTTTMVSILILWYGFTHDLNSCGSLPSFPTIHWSASCLFPTAMAMLLFYCYTCQLHSVFWLSDTLVISLWHIALADHLLQLHFTYSFPITISNILLIPSTVRLHFGHALADFLPQLGSYVLPWCPVLLLFVVFFEACILLFSLYSTVGQHRYWTAFAYILYSRLVFVVGMSRYVFVVGCYFVGYEYGLDSTTLYRVETILGFDQDTTNEMSVADRARGCCPILQSGRLTTICECALLRGFFQFLYTLYLYELSTTMARVWHGLRGSWVLLRLL